MGNPRLEDERRIKDIRNLYRLKHEQNHTAFRDLRDYFRIKK